MPWGFNLTGFLGSLFIFLPTPALAALVIPRRCHNSYAIRNVVSAQLQPMLKTPYLGQLSEWKKMRASDSRYIDGLTACEEWGEEELTDDPFEDMDEERQRRLDSWAFGVKGEVSSSFDHFGDSEEGILCSELVTSVGKDKRFYWPTLRLVHLVLKPTTNTAVAAAWVLRAAEDAVNFCDAQSLRLDFAHLRLTLSQPAVESPGVMALTEESVAAAIARAGTSSTATSAIQLVEGNVDWGELFTSLRSKNAYCEDDYIPGAT